MKKLLPVLALLLLSGCAATSDADRAKAEGTAVMQACLKASSQAKMLAMKVPAADNLIANKMVVAALKMNSGSTTVDQLVRLLSSPAKPSVVVFGANDDIVAATLEAALTKLPANVDRSSQQVCFSRDVPLSPELQQAADTAKIELLAVQD